jgi:serine/threonine protein kinase
VPGFYGVITFTTPSTFTRDIGLDISGERPPVGLLLEFVPGIQLDPDSFNYAEWALVAQTAITGLERIHAARVLHGDTFPRNIMVVRNEGADMMVPRFRVVWIDFDCASVWPDDDDMTENECRRESYDTWEWLFKRLVCWPQ